MDTLLGLIMYVSWIWSVVIIVRKTKGTTTLEQVVLYTGLALFIFLLIGITIE